MKSNFFRKTFASYHFAKFKNENLTAAEMGNSPKVIDEHYRAVATAEMAKLFWNIDPKTAKGVAEGIFVLRGISEGNSKSSRQ